MSEMPVRGTATIGRHWRYGAAGWLAGVEAASYYRLEGRDALKEGAVSE